MEAENQGAALGRAAGSPAERRARSRTAWHHSKAHMGHHSLSISGISSGKDDNSSRMASTVTNWCQQACPDDPRPPGHGGLLVPANASRLT